MAGNTVFVTVGTNWLSGTGSPSGSLGNLKDYYIDNSTNNYYYKSGTSTWTLQGSIQGSTGAAGAGYGGTSTTSILIGTGSQTFTTQSGLAYGVGARVRAAYQTTPSNYMEGVVTSYSGTTLTINVDTVGGAGTFALWSFNIAGNVGASGSGTGDMLKSTYDPANVAGQLLKDPGSNGILKRTASGTTAVATGSDLPTVAGLLCHAYTSTNQSIATSTWTKAVLDLTSTNVGSCYNTTTSQFTAPATGGYAVRFTGTIQVNGTGARYFAVWKNGTNSALSNILMLAQFPMTASSNYITHTLSSVVSLASGDTLEGRLFQDGGVSQNTFAQDSNMVLEVSRLW